MDAPLAALEAAQTGVDIIGELGALEGIEAGISDALGAFPSDTGQGDLEQITGAGAAIDNGVGSAQLVINDAASAGSTIGITIPPITGINVSPPTQPPAPPLPPVGGGGIGGKPGNFTLTLQNLTNAGAEALFHVRDRFNIHITGTPGANIYVTATHNRVQGPTGSMGVIGPTGVLDIGGTMGAGDVGQWVEDWYNGNQLIREIAFQVFP